MLNARVASINRADRLAILPFIACRGETGGTEGQREEREKDRKSERELSDSVFSSHPSPLIINVSPTCGLPRYVPSLAGLKMPELTRVL
jgi:hypothetical protein